MLSDPDPLLLSISQIPDFIMVEHLAHRLGCKNMLPVWEPSNFCGKHFRIVEHIFYTLKLYGQVLN